MLPGLGSVPEKTPTFTDIPKAASPKFICPAKGKLRVITSAGVLLGNNKTAMSHP